MNESIIESADNENDVENEETLIPDNNSGDSKSETDCEISMNLRKLKRKKFILGDHIKVIEGSPVVYFCSICKHKFKWKRQGAYHEYCRTGKRPLQCNLCPKRFVTNAHLQYHLLTHSGEYPYHCTFCSKAYKQKDKLKRHEKIHKDSNAGKHPCPICRKMLSCASTLKLHILTHSTDRPYKCKECKKGFTNEYDHKRHLSRHSGISNFVCEQCGKSFPRKFNLNAHYVIHSGRRPFQCSICDCAFKKKYELTRHIKQHEKGALFECNICLTKFSRKDNLLRHARNAHPGEEIIIKLFNTIAEDSIQKCIEQPQFIRKSVIVTAPTSITENILQDRQPVIQLAPSSRKSSDNGI